MEGDMNRPSSQKINKGKVKLNRIISQLDLINIYIIFHHTQQNTHSSLAELELSPRQITFGAIKYTLAHMKEQRSKI
jgi:hypothetical protein